MITQNLKLFSQHGTLLAEFTRVLDMIAAPNTIDGRKVDTIDFDTKSGRYTVYMEPEKDHISCDIKLTPHKFCAAVGEVVKEYEQDLSGWTLLKRLRYVGVDDSEEGNWAYESVNEMPDRPNRQMTTDEQCLFELCRMAANYVPSTLRGPGDESPPPWRCILDVEFDHSCEFCPSQVEVRDALRKLINIA